MRPDLNIDLGELPDEPAELYSLAHRVNVACGGHAGDARSMHTACALARDHGALVGAHPGYEDPARFGRVALALPPGALRSLVAAQCSALARAARASGTHLVHVKPHGALYHVVTRDAEAARELVEGVTDALGPVALVGPPEGALRDACQARALPYLREGFADRRYLPDGSLAPRSEPGAVLTDPSLAAAQALALAGAGRHDTLCVHGDTPGAVAVARAVRAALEVLG